MDPLIRPVRPEEHAEVGELVVRTYETVVSTRGYADELRDVADRLRTCDVLVAEIDGRVVGTVTYVPGPGPYAEVDDPDAASIRMLAVVPDAQGRGVGEGLVRTCLARAVAAGRARLLLHTQEPMQAAQRLYARLGFVRRPEHDLRFPDVALLAFGIELSGRSGHGEGPGRSRGPVSP